MLSWKAKRNGTVYCAPACGGGCKHKEYLTANKRADALVKKCEREVGGKWVKRVWENLGWHYSVSLKNGNISISESLHLSKGLKGRHYSIMGFGGGTPTQVHVAQWSKSIKWLVNKQLALVKTQADRWNDYIEKNKKALNKTK